MKLPRMTDWGLWSTLLLGLIWWLAPQQLAVLVYKMLLITVAACVCYWIDRSLFPYARPHQFTQDRELLFAAMLRRAIIIGAGMVAASLGM